MNILAELMIQKFTCKKKNHKIVTDPETGKKSCEKMSKEEIKNRQKGSKKAALKRKSKSALIMKKAIKTRMKNQKMNIKQVTKEIN